MFQIFQRRGHAKSKAGTEVGARPSDEKCKRTSVSRAQSSWAGIGDEMARHMFCIAKALSSLSSF